MTAVVPGDRGIGWLVVLAGSALGIVVAILGLGGIGALLTSTVPDPFDVAMALLLLARFLPEVALPITVVTVAGVSLRGAVGRSNHGVGSPRSRHLSRVESAPSGRRGSVRRRRSTVPGVAGQPAIRSSRPSEVSAPN